MSEHDAINAAIGPSDKTETGSGCIECEGVVLGLDHCDVCRQPLHAECGNYHPLGARIICSACADIDNEEAPDE